MLMKIAGVGKTGVNSDTAPHELPTNVFTNVSNARFYQGYVQSVFHDFEVLDIGSKPVMSTDYGRAMIGFSKDKIALATGTKLYVYNGTAFVDYSGAATITASTDWTSLSFSNCIVFVNPATKPQGLLPGGTTYSTLPAWDSNWLCKTMVGYKNTLIALYTTESGTAYPQRLRWSSPTEPNALPASWDATDPATLAGFNDLTDATGNIVTGKQLGDVLYVYTTKEIFAMQYVGGNSLFNFSKINSEIGLLSRKCITDYKGNHVLMTKDNVYMFNGTNAVSIVNGKIRERLFKSINTTYVDNIQVIAKPQYNEVWVCYPNSASTGQLNRAAVYNVEDGTWSFRSLNNLVELAVLRKPTETGSLWSAATYTWDSASAAVQWEARDFGSDVLLATNTSGDLYLVDQLTQGSSNMVVTLERNYIDLDDSGQVKSTSVKNFRSIYPQFSGSGNIMIQVGVADYPMGTIAWGTAKKFVIGTDTRVDFRASGRYACIKFTCTSKNTNWKLTGYDLEFDERFRGKSKRT